MSCCTGGMTGPESRAVAADEDDDDDDVSIFSCDRCTLKILNLKNKYFYSISRRVCLFIFISLAVDTVFRLGWGLARHRHRHIPSCSCISQCVCVCVCEILCLQVELQQEAAPSSISSSNCSFSISTPAPAPGLFILGIKSQRCRIVTINLRLYCRVLVPPSSGTCGKICWKHLCTQRKRERDLQTGSGESAQ